MLRFEDGKHLKNYLLKILKNTNSDITQQQKMTLNKIIEIYQYLEFHVDIVECPVVFDTSFQPWIEYAKKGKVDVLCKIMESTSDLIPKLKSHEISFDNLFNCIDLNMRYRKGYLERKPSDNDVYYPFLLAVIDMKAKIGKCALRKYNKPDKELTNNYGCYIIYDLDNPNEVVYVGKSNANLFRRSYESAKDRTGNRFSKIELLEMPSHADTNIYEMYYIAKYKPKYNIDSTCEDSPSFEMPNIANKYELNMLSEELFEIKHPIIDCKVVTKEEFWSNDKYILYSDENVEKVKKEFYQNEVNTNPNVSFCKDTFIYDGVLCVFEILDKKIEHYSN